MKNFETSSGVNLSFKYLDKLGKEFVNKSRYLNSKVCLKNLVPYFTNGFSDSLKLLHSKPKATDPILSSVKQAEKSQKVNTF